MKLQVLTLLLAGCWLAVVRTPNQAAEKDKDELQGQWLAVSIVVNGKAAPPAEVKRTRFAFKAGQLLVNGARKNDDRKVAGTYKTDATRSPKHVDFILRGKTFAGIYEIKGDQLKICYEIGGNAKNRPTTFATNRTEELVLIVFKRQKP